MEDTLQETDSPVRSAGAQAEWAAQVAPALGDLLLEHRGGEVTVLDIREQNSWTDFFIIATVTSSTHLDGLERHIKEFCDERELQILRRSRKPAGQEEEWRIIDLGPIVIHLMTGRARSFYELERLHCMRRVHTSYVP